MTNLRTAAEMALNTLDAISESGIYYKENPFDAYMRLRSMARGAIEALHQALAQDEQEPDNWWDNKEYVKSRFGDSAKIVGVKHGLPKDVFKQTQPDQEHFCDTHCVHTDHHPDCKIGKQQALNKKADNARELGLDYELSKYSDIISSGGFEPRNKVDAQPEQEPVAWLWLSKGKPVNALMRKPNMGDGYYAEKGFSFEPLFTAPPKREWQELTDEDWHNLPTSSKQGCERDAEIFNWIEDKLKEKNT